MYPKQFNGILINDLYIIVWKKAEIFLHKGSRYVCVSVFLQIMFQ